MFTMRSQRKASTQAGGEGGVLSGLNIVFLNPNNLLERQCSERKTALNLNG